MKYFHRTTAKPDEVIGQATAWFGSRLTLAEEGPRRRRFAGSVGQLAVSAVPEGGHYTLVTVETNQPGESELDRLAKRFLGVVHTMAEPDHALRGGY
jgi:hypothetical protein